MNFSMDEAGLASALFEMGDNEPRIYKIFVRLHSAHQSDVDDVALEYVKRLQQEPGRVTIGRLRRSERLMSLLIKALDRGITTSEEKKAIDFLREGDDSKSSIR